MVLAMCQALKSNRLVLQQQSEALIAVIAIPTYT